MQKQKIKIKTGTKVVGQFTAEIQEIQNTFSYLNNTSSDLETYLSSFK